MAFVVPVTASDGAGALDSGLCPLALSLALASWLQRQPWLARTFVFVAVPTHLGAWSGADGADGADESASGGVGELAAAVVGRLLRDLGSSSGRTSPGRNATAATQPVSGALDVRAAVVPASAPCPIPHGAARSDG